ncbi:SWIM-type domain-containing protein [Plasmodiophora brassicae]
MADCSDARWRQIVLRGAMKHYEHFERADMPVEGWRVDVAAHRCPCALAHKFGFCVHIVAALKKSNLPIPGQVAPVGRFVNRAPRPAPNRGRRGQRRAGQGPRGGGRGVPAQEEVRARPQGYLPGPGRPRMLGGALDIE